jgi:hypothetical protein
MELKLLLHSFQIFVKNIACMWKNLAINKEAKQIGLLTPNAKAGSKLLGNVFNFFHYRLSVFREILYKKFYILLKINLYKHTKPIIPWLLTCNIDYWL